MIRVTAPGKMVLLGEYTVLFGAPAVVAAVNRRAAVELAPSPSSRWVVTAPGYAEGEAEFHLAGNGALQWRDEGAASTFSVVTRLIEGLREQSLIHLEARDALELMLDTREFFETSPDGRCKLGLGSSAAMTVALITAFSAESSASNRFEGESGALQTLIDLHRQCQGGRGSGIDVAASLHGGVLRFQIDERSRASAEPMALPPDLHLRTFWTGASASTGVFLETLERRLAEDPAEVGDALDVLDRWSREGVGALAGGKTASFLAAVDGFWRGLEDLGRTIRMPIVSEPHLRLRQLACEFGVSYKPSGAGGGDLGVGISTEQDSLDRMCRAAREAGFQVLDLAVDPRGATLEDR